LTSVASYSFRSADFPWISSSFLGTNRSEKGHCLMFHKTFLAYRGC